MLHWACLRHGTHRVSIFTSTELNGVFESKKGGLHFAPIYISFINTFPLIIFFNLFFPFVKVSFGRLYQILLHNGIHLWKSILNLSGHQLSNIMKGRSCLAGKNLDIRIVAKLS